MAVQPGEVYYTDMPYPDGGKWVSKDRPMLVLATYGSLTSQVVVLCMVTSSPRRVAHPGPTDVSIPDFASAGLIKPSVVRPQRILTLDASTLRKRIGSVDAAVLAQAQAVAKAFINSAM